MTRLMKAMITILALVWVGACNPIGVATGVATTTAGAAVNTVDLVL